MKKYAFGIAGTVFAALVLSTALMAGFRYEQRKASFVDAASAVKAVIQIQTSAIDDGYFCWTKVQDLVKSAQISEADSLLQDILTLYPTIQSASISRNNPPLDFELSGADGTLTMRFSLKDDMGQNPLPGWVGVVRLNFQALLDTLRPKDRIVVDPANGEDIGFGIRARFLNPLMEPFDYLIVVLVSIVGSFPFIFIFWKRSAYFYESKGVGSILFLFEQTERVSATHSRKVAQLTLFLGSRMGLKRKKLRDLYTAALLHDIGKISIPSDILTKSGALTDAEIKLIKAHPVVSASILKNFKELEHLSPVVLHHHERMDGSGYPDGLKGEAIPFNSRVIAVVDVFEALIGLRPYRDPISSKEAFAALRRMPLDQSIVAALIENYPKFESFKTPSWVS